MAMNGYKNILITGATGGIGKALVTKFSQEGYHVYGTSRDPSRISPEEQVKNVTYLPLDLTDPSSIQNLVTQIPEIDVLINNAGRSQIGSIEETQLTDARKLFELNFMGCIHLTQLILPAMRTKKKGLILNISSLAGKSPVPFSAIYASTKSALDTLSLGLRYELAPYNIKVVSIAPTSVNTKIPQEKYYSDESPYLHAITKAKKVRDEGLVNATGPEIIVEKIFKIFNLKNPKAYYAIGDKSKFLSFMIKHSSSLFLEKNVKKRYNLV